MAQVIESALIHGTASKAEATAKAVELFRALAIPNPETIGARYPHQVSGGQLQRLMAAMALITDPEVVIFDEPTTALDVTTQIEVLKAFKSAIRDRNTTGIYVTHDLAVIAQIADSITVLRHGEVRETGEVGQLIATPENEYTKSLLAAAEPALRLVTDDAAGRRSLARGQRRRRRLWRRLMQTAFRPCRSCGISIWPSLPAGRSASSVNPVAGNRRSRASSPG